MSEPIHATTTITQLISELHHGEIEQRLTSELAELVEAVQETGKLGTLTIKLHVKKEGSVAAVLIDSSLKKPKHPFHGSIMHFGQNGALLSEDPRQLKLKLKNVEPVKLRSLGGDEGEEQ